jgi:hypothetical protein
VSIQARNGHCLIKNHVCSDAELTSKGVKGMAEWNSKSYRSIYYHYYVYM